MSSPHEPATGVSGSPLDVEDFGFDGSAALAELDQPRQVLVFQTLQDALTASPPRPEATFVRVVKAYTTLRQVVVSAAKGRFSDADLATLQNDIEIAGGEIAPGLRAQGANSLSALRAQTFGLLAQGYEPIVVAAVCSALNAHLQVKAIDEIDDLLQAVSVFFADLTPSAANAETLQSFSELDVARQVLVFDSMKAGILAQPPRQDATFSALVTAYLAERDVLLSARRGMLDDPCIAHLENSLVAAGGMIEPGLWAHGRSSVAAFRAETFRILQQLLPADVMRSALKSLNTGLSESEPQTVFQVFDAAKAFFSPLLNENWDSQIMRSFRALDLVHQSFVFETIELSLRRNPGLEVSIFASAVKAVSQERLVVACAAEGALTLEMLQDLKAAIDLCGGEIAPGITSEGAGSISEFCDQCFVALARVMPRSVYVAAMAALNASLRTAPIDDLAGVMAVVKGFTAPLRGVRPGVSPVSVPPCASEVQSVATFNAAELVGGSAANPADDAMELPVELVHVASGVEDSVGVLEHFSDVIDESEFPAGFDTQDEQSDENSGPSVNGLNQPDESGLPGYQGSGGDRSIVPEDQPSVGAELSGDPRRKSAYPIFSLNTPAVAPYSADAPGLEHSVDDQEEGGDIMARA